MIATQRPLSSSLNSSRSVATGTKQVEDWRLGRLNTFVAPRPSGAMIAVTKWVNRIFMLRGLPVLRDIPGLNRFPPCRGLANIRHVDLPAGDERRLAAMVGPGKAVFFTPNHPEFFTDWMIDKEILARVAPKAASWATNTVVNGMGPLAQKFWLANNLIAQIPGNSEPARQFSVEWALAGNGVLLHPEGAVGWHSDHVAPLMPGAVEMGFQALERGRRADPAFEVWIAPVVWRLHFLRDVEAALGGECAYVEMRLRLATTWRDLPTRVYAIYEAPLARDEERFAVSASRTEAYATRQRRLLAELASRLQALIGSPGRDGDLPRLARRWMRENESSARLAEVRQVSDAMTRLARIGTFAFQSPEVTRENLAEHLKRIRTDYCKGTLRDTLGALLPQPAGARRAIIRVPEPIALHSFAGDVPSATDTLHTRLQRALDDINATLKAQGAFRSYPNPFFAPAAT